MLIRPAAAADVAVLAVLVGQYWAFEGISGFQSDRVEGLLRELLASPQRGACWIADEGDGVCGYLLSVYMFSLEHGGLMAEIDEVFVTASARSAGVGSLLLSSAERDMAAQGVIRIQLQLGVGNQRARAFYEQHGFSARAGYELLDKPL